MREIGLIIILCCILNSCSKIEMNNEVIVNSIITKDTTIIVKLKKDSFLIKEVYNRNINLIIRIDKDSFLLKDVKAKKENIARGDLKTAYDRIITKYKLVRREFYSKADTLCQKMETYIDDGELIEQITFYKEPDKVKQKKLLHGGEVVYEQNYFKDGRPHDTLSMDFILKYSRVDNDTICIKIEQPYPNEFNCTFEFYADIGISEDEIFELSDVTIDSINGIGEICFPTQPNVFLVGNFYHIKPNKNSLFQVAKKFKIDTTK